MTHVPVLIHRSLYHGSSCSSRLRTRSSSLLSTVRFLPSMEGEENRQVLAISQNHVLTKGITYNTGSSMICFCLECSWRLHCDCNFCPQDGSHEKML